MIKILKKLDKITLSLLSILILLFIFYPVFNVFYNSFVLQGELSFKSFEFLITKNYLIINSIKVSIVTAFITTLVAFCLGILYINLTSFAKKILYWLLTLTMISPPFVSSLSYIKLFGRKGYITNALFGLSPDIYGEYSVIIMQSISLLSVSSLLIISALNNIDVSQVYSAKSLGARTNSVIIDIIIANLSPAIKIVAILSFIRGIADFSTPLIVGGRFETLASSAYFTFISEGDIAKSAAMNILLTIPVIILLVFYVKSNSSLKNNSSAFTNIDFKLEKSGIIYFTLVAIACIFILVLIMQYLAIIFSAFTDYYRGQPFFTLNNFFSLEDYVDSSIIRSILYSLVACVVATIIGILLQYYIKIREVRYLKYLDFIATIPYMVPGTFFGIGYILSFNSEPLALTGTALIVVLNVIFKQLPFSTKIFASNMDFIDTNEVKSAKDLGANDYDVFKDVIVPNSKANILLSCITIFNATMTTVGSIIFLVYPGQKVLTLVMFDVINSGKYDIASAIAVLIIVICIVFNLLFILLNKVLGGKKQYVFRTK